MSQYVERRQKVISSEGLLERIEEEVIVKRKKCPFCGGTAHTVELPDEDGVEKAAQKCKQCGAMTELYDTLEESVDAWNKRV